MAKRKETASARLRRLLAEEPDLTVSEMVAAMRKRGSPVSVHTARKVRYAENAKATDRRVVLASNGAGEQKMAVSVSVPSGGLVLKLLNGGGRSLGTIMASPNGFTFSKPNAKQHGAEIGYQTAGLLFGSGLLK